MSRIERYLCESNMLDPLLSPFTKLQCFFDLPMMAEYLNSFPKPILKHTDIINGILPIEITNLDDIHDPDLELQFTIHYKFHASDNTQNGSKKFLLRNIDNLKRFYIKVPLYLLSYKFEYNLSAHLSAWIAAEDNNEEDAKFIERMVVSENYQAEIPSILIEPGLKVNDIVDYAGDQEETDTIFSAKVLRLCDDDKIEIQYIGTGNKVIVDSSKLMRYEIDLRFMIDLTYKDRAIFEMQLGIPESDGFKIWTNLYKPVASAVRDMFCHYAVVEEDEVLEQDFESGQFKQLCQFIATHVSQFLHQEQHHYRIKCVFGDTYLKSLEPWQDAIFTNMMKARNGEWSLTDMFEMWTSHKWSCDMCRMAISWYEAVYGCRCDNSTEFGDNHVVCLTCIHSIVKQYNELKPFIKELLEDELNDNCIEEIVAFCVGKVMKFENMGQQHHKDPVVIDDTKHIGSKRKMRDDTSVGWKRQRLE